MFIPGNLGFQAIRFVFNTKVPVLTLRLNANTIKGEKRSYILLCDLAFFGENDNTNKYGMPNIKVVKTNTISTTFNFLMINATSAWLIIG